MFEEPTEKGFLISFFNLMAHFLIFGINTVKILSLEDIYVVFPADETLLIPLDLLIFNAFIATQMSNTEYIGKNTHDYWQYFLLRTLPFI